MKTQKENLKSDSIKSYRPCGETCTCLLSCQKLHLTLPYIKKEKYYVKTIASY